jgi:hypothetical protein
MEKPVMEVVYQNNPTGGLTDCKDSRGIIGVWGRCMGNFVDFQEPESHIGGFLIYFGEFVVVLMLRSHNVFASNLYLGSKGIELAFSE